MSREIDERIVAMYFDNKDFEKNAHTTIDTLGQLKQSLDLEGAAKGMEELQKAGRRLDFTKVENSARSLKNTLGGIGNFMSKAFDIGTAPLQHLNSLINTFRNYAGKVIGFDVASKVVGGVENALREVTIQPITAGWHEYELKMDSIKTIMSGSGESLDKVKAKLEELNLYADKTIYSFSDMTSNIGKFVNNGVALDRATSAMKGIANAAADAGQGAAEASRAMYNISQAFGVGSMKLVDWKSIENANMATQKLKDTFLQLGGAMGKLQQFTDKEGRIHYFYQDEGKKAPSMAGLEKMSPQEIEAWFKKNKIDEITAKNFRESLNKNWLTNEVMEAGFRVYSGDLNNATELMSMIPGLTQAQADALFKIGQEAMEAATQVRTFSKMWDALKEAAQSGWAQSLEYVFGDMEEATKLWTDLNDMFSKAIGDSADARNEMLMAWRGLQKMDDGTYEKIQGQFDGRDQLIYALKGMIRLIATFKQTFSEAWTAVFGKLDGRKLANLSLQLNYFVNRLTVWFGQTAKGGTRLEKIKMGLQGVFTVIKTGITLVKSAFDLVKRFLGPIADVAITAFGNIGEKLSELKDLNAGQIFKKLGEWTGKLWEKITHLDFGEALSKIGEWFSGIWEKTKGTIRQWMQDNDLQGLLDFLRKIRSRISSIWNSVKSWEGWAAIGQFFGNIWGWLSEQFGSKKRHDSNGHELADDRPPVLVLLSNVWEGVKKIWSTIARWGGWKKIADLFGNAWGWIRKQFTMDESTGEVPILVFFRNTWNGIAGIWNQLSGWEGWQKIGGFFSGIWESITGLFAGVNLEEFDLVTFLKNIWHGLEEVWGNITKWYEDAGIGDFFRGLWDSINHLFSGGEIQHGYRNGKLESWYADSPIVAFFKNLITSVSKAWDEVVAWPMWNTIGTFLSDTWNWIVTQFRPARRHDENGHELKDNRSPVSKFLSDIWNGIQNVWKSIVEWPVWKVIGQFLTDTWTWIVTLFRPVRRHDENGHELKDNRSPVSQFLINTWESVKSIWKQIVEWEGWKAIGQFLSDTWGWITSFFKGKSMTTDEAGNIIPVEGIAIVGKETEDALKKAPEEKELNLLQTVLETLKEFWETVKQTADKVTGNSTVTRLWDSLGRMFESLVNLFELVSKIAQWATENPVYAGIIGIVVTIIKGWFGKQQLKFTTQLATIAANTDSLGTQIMKIGIGFGIIAAAVYALGEMDRDKLLQGGAAFVAIAGVAGGLLIALKNFNDSRPTVAEEPVKAWERVVNNLIKWIGIAGSIAIAMSLLPNIVKSFGEAKKLAPDLNGGDIASAMLGLTALISGTSLVLAAVQKITGGQGLNPVAALKTALAVLGFIGAVVVAFTGAGWISDLIGMEEIIDKMDNAADMLAKLGEAIGRFFGAIVGGFTGQKDSSKMNVQLAGLKEGTDAASEISQEKLQHLSMVMSMLGTIQDSLPDYSGILDKWLNGNKLKEMGDQLPSLGLGLAGFVGYIGDVKLDKFEQLRESLNALSLFVSVVETMQKAAAELNGSNIFVDVPRTWREWEKVLDTVTSQKYLEAATALAAAIQRGLGGADGKLEGLEFNAMPIVEAITKAIGLGDTAIAHAVRDMVQHGLDALNTPEYQEGWNGFEVPEGVKQAFTEVGELTGQFQGLWGTNSTTGQNNTFTDFANSLLGDTNMLLGENGTISKTIGDLEKEFGKLNPQNLLSWKDEKGNDIDMTGELTKMLGELQTAVDEMPSFEIRITPVFEMSNLNGSAIENLLAQRTIGIGVKMPKLQVEIDNDQSLTELRGINQRLDQLSAKITQENASNMLAIYNTARHVDDLGANINGLGARIAAMKLYLYPNQLVGGLIGPIDAALGQRAGITSRTGVSPGTTATGAVTTSRTGVSPGTASSP